MRARIPVIGTHADLTRLLKVLDHLPADEPFTTGQANARGVRPAELRAMVARGLLRHPVRGVYVRPEIEDDLARRSRAECQIEIAAPDGAYFLLDMGLREHKFAGEYDGEEFHGEDEREHDDERRDWARRDQDCTIVVARKHNIYRATRTFT